MCWTSPTQITVISFSCKIFFPLFVHLVLYHSSAYLVFCLHGWFSRNTAGRGPPVLTNLLKLVGGGGQIPPRSLPPGSYGPDQYWWELQNITSCQSCWRESDSMRLCNYMAHQRPVAIGIWLVFSMGFCKIDKNLQIRDSLAVYSSHLSAGSWDFKWEKLVFTMDFSKNDQ